MALTDRITIVIPCYQHQREVAAACESARQPGVARIIVVDDGSELAVTRAGVGERVKLLRHQRNQGLSAARNTGFLLARTEWVIPLDADDTLVKPCAWPDLDRAPDVGAVVPGPGAPDLQTLAVRCDWPATALIRRDAWCAVRRINHHGYDPELRGYEEWLFWVELLLCGWRVEVADFQLFTYSRGPGLHAWADQHRAELLRHMAARLRREYDFQFLAANPGKNWQTAEPVVD